MTTQFLWNDFAASAVGMNSAKYKVSNTPSRITVAGLVGVAQRLPIQVALTGVNAATKSFLTYWTSLYRNGAQVALSGVNTQMFESVPGLYQVGISLPSPFGAPVAVVVDTGTLGSNQGQQQLTYGGSFGSQTSGDTTGGRSTWLWNEINPEALVKGANTIFRVGPNETAVVTAMGLGSAAANALPIQVAVQGPSKSGTLTYWQNLYRNGTQVTLNGLGNQFVEFREGTYRVVVSGPAPFGMPLAIVATIYEGIIDSGVDFAVLSGAIAGAVGGTPAASLPQVVAPLYLTGPTTLSATVDATAFADATSGPVTVTLPLIASIPIGQSRAFTLKKSDISPNAVSYAASGADTIEQAQVIPVTFGSTLSWSTSSSVNLLSDANTNQWLIV